MTTATAATDDQPRRSVEEIVADMLRELGQITIHQWVLGDLALECHGPGPLPKLQFKSKGLAECADRLGKSYKTVHSWAKTAQAWPADQRGVDVEFDVYRELANWDDREALLQKFVAECAQERILPSYDRLRVFLPTQPVVRLSDRRASRPTVSPVPEGLPRDAQALLDKLRTELGDDVLRKLWLLLPLPHDPQQVAGN
jgi:hypothetical protein